MQATRDLYRTTAVCLLTPYVFPSNTTLPLKKYRWSYCELRLSTKFLPHPLLSHLYPYHSKMKLIFDTDPGDDDIIAILLALSWPDTQVLAYIASFGNVDVEHTYNNILKLYGVLDKHMKASPEVMDRYQSLKHVSTLIKGADRPIEGPLPGDGAFFHGTDGMSASIETNLGKISLNFHVQVWATLARVTQKRFHYLIQQVSVIYSKLQTQ